MLIEKDEYDVLERRIDREWKDWQIRKSGGFQSPATRFLLKNPHLLLLLDCDDYRVLRRTKSNVRLVEDYVGGFSAFALGKENLFRESASGRWILFQGLIPPGLPSLDAASTERSLTEPLQCHFIGPGGADRRFPTEEFLRRLKRSIDDPTDASKSIILPSAWLPSKQALQRVHLVDTAQNVLRALHATGDGLRNLSWRTLEEIVAELLRSLGLEIHLTPASKDGGRDIVARGELIPGEPLLLSVEVKQKNVVGLHDVQRALYANRNFPGLMIATAGSFTAGVIAEKNQPGNHMRLFLKDGIALQQWIRAYGRRNFSPTLTG